QLIGFRLFNDSHRQLDMTLLFIDSGFGIHQIYPHRSTQGANRVEAGRDVPTDILKITGNTVGTEQVVLIAVNAEGPPKDFGFLEQPTLELARKDVGARGGSEDDGLNTPLGKL